MSPTASPQAAVPPSPPRFLDQVQQAAWQRFGRPEPAQRWVDWVRRFILFHNKKHPGEMGGSEVALLLSHVGRSGTAQVVEHLQDAHEALTFLYHDVLHRDVGELPLPQPPRLLDRMHLLMRVRHYSQRTEACYLKWAEPYIRFHGLRHPKDMGTGEITAFLTHLAVDSRVAASTQNQALNALVFLYTQVLGLELGSFDAVRARRPLYLPTVLAPEEVRRVLAAIAGGNGVFRLMASLLYGAGLRRAECCALRVHDVDLARGQIQVRHGKGGKDRVVMLPRSLRPAIERQIAWRRELQTGTKDPHGSQHSPRDDYAWSAIAVESVAHGRNSAGNRDGMGVRS
jgi:integrase